MMPAGGAETRGQQIATLTRLARDLLLASETEQALGKAERAIEGLADDAAERRMVEQTRYAIEHHRRVPASLIQERAALRTVAQAAWIEATIEERLFHLRPVPGKDRRAVPRLCRLHRLERASLRRNGVDLRARRDGARASRRCSRNCGTGCCRSSMPRGPGLGLAPISCTGTSRRRGSAPSAWRSPRSSDTTSSAGVSTRRCIRSRCRSPATTCASPPVTTGTIFRPPCSAPPTRSGMRSTSRASTPPIPARPSRRISWDSMRSEAPASAPMNPSRASGRTTSFAASASGSCHFADLQRHFPDQLGDVSAEEFYRAVTRVEPGFIRVEADELTYDFHIMLRAEIECALMDGSLPVSDLPEAWNAAIRRDLGSDRPERLAGRPPGCALVDRLYRLVPDLHRRQRDGAPR